MKNYAFILIFSLFSIVAQSQLVTSDFNLSGRVYNAAIPTEYLENRVVYIWEDSTNNLNPYFSSDITDNMGYYHINVVNGAIVGDNRTFYLGIYDCTGNMQVLSFSNQVNHPSQNLPICLSSTSTCNGAYTYQTLNQPNQYFFTPQFYNSNSSTQYFWSFGDGTSVTGDEATHTYADSGSYIVCLNVFNTQLGCNDSYCDTLYVGITNSGPCTIDFGLNQQNNSSGLFQFITTSPDLVNFNWDFGDGSTADSAAYVVHQYSQTGVYLVTLNATNINGCSAQRQKFVNVVEIDTVPSNIIFGQVYLDNNILADNVNVILYSLNLVDTSVTTVDTVNTTNGTYMFNNVFQGFYGIKAFMDSSSAYHDDFTPTYYAADVSWIDAEVVGFITSSYVVQGNIYMVPVDPASGLGVTGGVVTWDDTVRAYSFRGATAYLLNANGNIEAYGITGDDGGFTITNIPYGTYMLYVDYPGKYCLPIEVTISADAPNVSDISILLTDIPQQPLSVEEDYTTPSFAVYPNPTTDNATLVVETTKNAQLTLSIVNLMGQTVDVQTVNTYAGKNTVQLTTNNLAQGIYTLILRDSKGVAKAQKLIKQ